MIPLSYWSTSKGWGVPFQEMHYALVGSHQHSGCEVPTYFKMQKRTLLPQTFKPFPDGPRGASGLSPAGRVQPVWLSTVMVAIGWWGVADKRHPQVPGERCFLCPPYFHWPNTHEKWGKSVEKARLWSAEMLPLPPTVASAVFTSQLQLPTAVWEMDLGLRKQHWGWEWNTACFLNLDLSP